MSALRINAGNEIRFVDLGPQRHVRLPGHLGNTIPGGLVRGDSLGAGKPTRPVRVGGDEIERAQRKAATERRADANYRKAHLEDIRAKDRARKAPR